MSIFLAASCPGYPTRIFRMQGLWASYGFDHTGMLSDRPEVPFFHVYLIDGHPLLHGAGRKIRVNNLEIGGEEQFWILSGDSVYIEDFCFKFTITSPFAESLAAANDYISMLKELNEVEPVSYACWKVGALRKTLPLFANVSYSIGALDSASILVDLPEVKKHHCTLHVKPHCINIEAVHGKIKVDSVRVEKVYSFKVPSKLELLPSGYSLSLGFNPAIHALRTGKVQDLYQ